VSLGEYETGLRATYQAAKYRLGFPPPARIAMPKPAPVAAKPQRQPRKPRNEPVVCANLEEQIPTRWIRKIVIEISERLDLSPLYVVGSCRGKRFVAARVEIWATLHDMGVSTGRLGELFNKDHTSVAYGIRRFKGQPPKKHKPRGVK
jgi:hypothetical protein